jgi:hypothetical protein
VAAKSSLTGPQVDLSTWRLLETLTGSSSEVENEESALRAQERIGELKTVNVNNSFKESSSKE